MSKPRKNEQVRCSHFMWLLSTRNGIWYADGRANPVNAGRHSLGTKNRVEALRLLPDLDRVRAEDLGLIQKSDSSSVQAAPLSLESGRKFYEEYLARPRVAGGVRHSTRKRYRTVFDKFFGFADTQGITVWNQVTDKVLLNYAAHLESKDYANKSLRNELVTLMGAVRWFIGSGHLQGMEPIKLKLRKAESERPYCYTAAEVKAMRELCSQTESLRWLGNVIVTLACTGLRISELASLCWADVDLGRSQLTLTDETGHSSNKGDKRRETKSGRSRSFPINPELQKVLETVDRQGKFIFYGPRGGRFKPDTARRIFVGEVIEPLAEKFPSGENEKGFADGRFHSFRHYFCSTCANSGVPERIVMNWLGHADSEMIRHYYHLHDDEAKRRMDNLDFLGGTSGRSVGNTEDKPKTEDVEPPHPETSED